MNKKIFVLLACLIVALTVNADPITREQAQRKAEQYLQDKPGSRRLAPITNARKLAPMRKRIVTPTATELYYVFNRGENEGFVIVAGDDKMEGVLGYTDNGEFDYENLPCNMRYWLDTHADYIAYLQTTPKAAPKKVASHDAIEPMVTTKWNQGDPYNQECPNYFGLGRSVTGCAATAMAQVLYFQREKSVTETQGDMPSYTITSDDYGTMTVPGVPSGSPIDWNNMTDTYNSSSTAIQKKAVAQLMRYCGVSVEMGYSNSGSGAYSSRVHDAMNKYFGYGTAAKYAYSENYSDDSWDALLYNELKQGRPFYLSGFNEDGGHAFVGDGYKDGCFHINWGWGGSSDGYYALNKMKPGSQGIGGSDGGYADGQEAIYGCEPEDFSNKAMSFGNVTVKKLCLANWDSDNDGKFTYGEAAAVTDIGEVFKGQNISTFYELYYFTELTQIADDAFNGCTGLTAIRLPKKLKAIGARAFAGCLRLKTITLPENVSSIGEAAFQGCKLLPDLNLPLSIPAIEAHTFDGCATFKSVTIPICVQRIGEKAFAGCTKLTSCTMRTVTPQNIELGSDVFDGVSLSSATLNVQQGTGSYFQSADQWRDFGTIYEMRTLSQGHFANLELNKKYYLYNVGTGFYFTHGEAYGTQAIVADTETPMRYEFRRTASMDDGLYYLYSEDSPNDKKILFRTNTDGSVGSGINACFVDGATSKLSTTGHPAYWTVTLADGQSNIYTIQTPSSSSGYASNQYLGVQLDHASNAASPTYGLYSDVAYDDNALNCQWMLVPYDGDAEQLNAYTLQLANLLSIGKSKNIDVAREQAVYDNLNSSLEDVQKACRRMRSKLDFINFQEDAFRELVISCNFDNDANNEISYTEAALNRSFGTVFQNNSDITTLDDLKYFTKIEYIDAKGFMNCRKVLDVTLPNSVLNIKDQAFQGCSKLEKLVLPNSIETIGRNAFYNCLALKEIYVPVADPSLIKLGSNVFYAVKKEECVLYVPYGSRDLYANAATWKDFADIREMRVVQPAEYVEPQLKTDYYVYNLGSRRYLNRGEAYGTQSVVAKTGMVYQLRRSTSMADGIYYLYSEETGNDNKILFRTSTDGKVGKGVKANFVDGPTSRLTESGHPAYWNMQPVSGLNNVYTFQVPQNESAYVDGEYLGTNFNHETEFKSSPTYGTYWDIAYADDPKSCQWAFVKADELKANQEYFELTEQLKALLVKAEGTEVDASPERAVYDDFGATREQIKAAILSLNEKLHFIPFADNVAKRQSVLAWDNDEDGEVSFEEAAAVSDIGTTFRAVSGLKSLDELRYFTGISSIPAEAFRSNTTLVSATLPETVSHIGTSAFTSCSNLKYLALLNPSQVVTTETSGLPLRNLTVFVPASMIEAYQADETWGRYNIVEYTGTPVVTAVDASREYGRTTVRLTFTVSGAPINGDPVLATDLEATTPVGTYPITIAEGTITSNVLQLVEGALTVERAPVTVTAKSYSRNFHEPNPEFEITYSTLRNREQIDDVLTQAPTITCAATIDSPGGEYPIVVSGAEAQNYEFTYVNGTLTVVDPVGINGVNDDAQQHIYYDLSGRRIATPQQRGVYINDRKKVVK